MLTLSPDDLPPALPCWINGRAFLSMTEDFYTVRDHATGEPLRRTPLCGEAEVAEAVASARAALPEWQALGREARQNLLSAWSEALARYGNHFAQLLRQETGLDEKTAQAEVVEAITALRRTGAADGKEDASVRAIPVPADRPLVDAAGALAAALSVGATVVLHSDPSAPGAVYALVELSARVDVPPGVVNLVQGKEVVTAALKRHLLAQDTSWEKK